MSDAVMTIAELRKYLQDKAQSTMNAVGADAPVVLAPTPDPSMGLLGFPCFSLARVLRKAPPVIAQELAASIEPDAVIEGAQADKAYVNFRVRPAVLVETVLREAVERQERFGGDQADPKANWMVEYSAPNTNKPLHLGHLRNNLLGASVAKMLRFYGHNVTRVNLVNDRGIHICKSMLAYKLWGNGAEPSADRKGDRLVGDFYVEFDRRFGEEYAAWQQTEQAQQRAQTWVEAPVAAAKGSKKATAERTPKQFFAQYRDDYFNKESALGAQARTMLRQWEQGDAEVVGLWRKMTDWVLAGFEQSYQRMGVGFDEVQFESNTYKLGRSIALEGLERGVLTKRDDGAVVCDLTQVGLSGEKVLLRNDGTSVYMTQDLGTAVERFDKYQPDQLVYVVGDEQNYHFQVLFKILGLLRSGLSEHCTHLGYGMIRLPEGKMKSREGTVVDADDLMSEMHTLARAETQTRANEGKAHTEDLSADELSLRAERIGMAALKYFLLKYAPRTSFEYNPKASIDFLGQTGPYCLFNYARTRSLLRKVGGEPTFDANATHRLVSEREQEIVRQLFEWPQIVERAALGLDPSRIAEYAFELCKSFAFIFTDKAGHPIATCEDVQLRQARLLLVVAVGNTIKAAMALLGIDVLEEM